MKFITASHTDVGIKKKTNQDSMLILQADTSYGPVLLAAICDGMGGLAKGEVASASMVNGFAEWFKNQFPLMLSSGFTPEGLRASWDELVQRQNRRIADYGSSIHVDLGTTAVAFLAVGDSYYIMNVGDSRVYTLSDRIYQLTKDQTFVQREMDLGRMTYEQAMQNPQRNVLLQCIGASSVVQPDFFSGTLTANQVFLLCCDGFRHVIQPQEFYTKLNPGAARDQAAMKNSLITLTELNKERREEDNISAIAIRTC